MEMFDLATGLQQRGHDVEVYAIPYTLEGKRKVDSKQIYSGAVRYHEGLIHLIKAEVVYSMYHPFARSSFVTRAPMIASFHSEIWFSNARQKYGLIPKAAALLSDIFFDRETSRYDAVQVHYPSTVREIVLRAPNHPRIYTIEHFTDTELFKPNGANRADKFRVLYVGRPVWQKGFDLFIRLAHELSDDKIEFRFAGGKVEDTKVTSIGFVRNHESLARTYDEADLTVCPQRIEWAVGRSVLESLSCGTPVVITTRDVDPPLANCESLFRTGDYQELRNVVQESFSRWKSGAYDQERLSAAARKCIVENFSLSVTIEKYERMLTEVAFGR